MEQSLQIQKAADSTAPFLFSLPEAELRLEQREKAGEWTGERLFARNPELYGSIVRALGMGLNVEQCKDLFQVSDNTVRNIRERESGSVAEFRTKQGMKRRRAMDMLVDRIIEKAPSADIKDAVIAYGILDDKERLDSGAPTQRIEVQIAPAQNVYAALVKDIIDVEASVTGLGVEGMLQRGAAGGGSGGLVLDAEMGVSDEVSDDAQRERPMATGVDTETKEGESHE